MSMVRTACLLLCVLALSLTPTPPTAGQAKLDEGLLEKVVITLKRDRCFGSCPIYTLTICGDGTVEYEGIEFVRVKGKRSYKIPRQRVRELVVEFYRIDYFSLKDSYTSRDLGNGMVEEATDLPGTTTSIKIGDAHKSVYNYYGGPESLDRLEEKIDEVSGVARFVERRA